MMMMKQEADIYQAAYKAVGLRSGNQTWNYKSPAEMKLNTIVYTDAAYYRFTWQLGKLHQILGRSATRFWDITPNFLRNYTQKTPMREGKTWRKNLRTSTRIWSMANKEENLTLKSIAGIPTLVSLTKWDALVRWGIYSGWVMQETPRTYTKPTYALNDPKGRPKG